MIVDIHAHYYPPEYLERIGRPDLPPTGAAPMRSHTLEDRMRLLDRVGVDVQVLSVSQAQPYLATAGDAAEAAALGNDLFVKLCRDHPGRFYTFAALPLPHVEESLAEVDRVWDDPYVVGITIGCSINDTHIDDPVLGPVYQELDRRRALVFLHPRGERCVVDGGDYNLNWLVGAPFEDTVAALRLALSGIADQYRGIRFIVPHLGGTMPFILNRALRMAGGRGEETLRGMYYDTVADSADGLRLACEFWGPERLLFGTDYPYSTEAEFEERLTYLDRAGIEVAQLEEIRGTRAKALLRI